MDLKCKKKNTELLLGYKYFQFSQIQKFYIKQIEKTALILFGLPQDVYIFSNLYP